LQGFSDGPFISTFLIEILRLYCQLVFNTRWFEQRKTLRQRVSRLPKVSPGTVRQDGVTERKSQTSQTYGRVSAGSEIHAERGVYRLYEQITALVRCAPKAEAVKKGIMQMKG
jgi:hypothetical protein